MKAVTKKQLKQLSDYFGEFEKVNGKYPEWIYGATLWLTDFLEENNNTKHPELREFYLRMKQHQLVQLQDEIDAFKIKYNITS